MSGAAEALGRQIATAKDLSAVVRSMKALAASSITQYERAVASLRDYTHAVDLGLSVCLRDLDQRPGWATAPSGARGVIVFGADQGLVGRFNDELVEYTVAALRPLAGVTQTLWVVGDRLRDLATDAGLPPPTVLTAPQSVDGITPLVGRLLLEIEAARERDGMTDVYVFHNRPQAGVSYESAQMRLLPLDRTWQREMARLPWPSRALPEIIGGAATLADLTRSQLFVRLFQASAESLASENASRLAAMQRAETNIAELRRELTRKFHRVRQESIDDELFQVVSGYEALSPRQSW